MIVNAKDLAAQKRERKRKRNAGGKKAKTQLSMIGAFARLETNKYAAAEAELKALKDKAAAAQAEREAGHKSIGSVKGRLVEAKPPPPKRTARPRVRVGCGCA